MWNKPGKEQLAKIPRLYETEKINGKDKIIYLHFFIGGCDWYIAEFDGEDLFFGFAILNDPQNAEWGYISFQELDEITSMVSKSTMTYIGNQRSSQKFIGKEKNLENV